MNYKVFSIPPFDKQIKRLAKKYPSLSSDFLKLIHSLEENPKQGAELGKGCYKIRMAITSKGKGKSGGARVITHIVVDGRAVYLLSIYDKSERDTISDVELKELLKFIE